MSERTAQPEMLVEVAGLADAQLLALFISHRDEAAFTELVKRYRRLVWSVCRRVLSQTHDIEDAFQATFLVLVRDAGRIRRQKSLASWLYGVAYRLALELSRQRERQREVVSLKTEPEANDTFTELARLFVQQTVDKELSALPDKYRQPLVLHYLSGKSCKDVATELGLSEGAVDGLLKRGRQQLRTRLARRGVTLGAVWFVLNSAEQAVQAAAFEPLTQATVQTGMAYSVGKSVGVVSATILQLSGKELVTMSFISKPIASLAAAVCVLGLFVGGANWLLGSNPSPSASAPSFDTTTRRVRSQTPALLNANAESSNLLAAANDESSERVKELSRGKVTETPADEADGRAWDFQERSKTVQKIEEVLRKPTEVDFQDQPLTDVISFLSDFHHIPILLDIEALSESGVATDTPMTRTLTGVPLESALNIMLAPLKLDYVIANDVMTITTDKQASATMDARVYDLARLPSLEPKALSAIIMAVTKPDAWTEKGGPGSLVLGTDFVMINQNQRTHRKIVSLLTQLERQAKEAAKRRTVR